jgi:hypothetical protein
LKKRREKKATGNDDVPGDILQLLGKDSLRIVTHLISHLRETGHWHNDFTEYSKIWFSQNTTNFIVNHKYGDMFRLIQSSTDQFVNHI